MNNQKNQQILTFFIQQIFYIFLINNINQLINNDRLRYLYTMQKNYSSHNIYGSALLTAPKTVITQKYPTTPYKLNKDSQGNLSRIYEINSIDLNNHFHLFQWRKRIHHPIPKVIHTNTDPLHPNIISITCEHINFSFNQIPLLKLQQTIYFLSQMLLGYQEIYSRLGFVCIQSRFLGLNNKGQILLWINQNLIAHYAGGNKIINEKQIVLKVVQLAESKAEDKNHVFFCQLRKLEQKFKVILDFIIGFKMKHKLKIIPKIQCDNSVKYNSDKVIQINNFQSRPQTVSQSFNNINQNRVKVTKIPQIYDNSMKNSEFMKSSHSSGQFMNASRMSHNTNHFSTALIRSVDNRISIMQQNTNKHTPNVNLIKSVHYENNSGPKINFSYSQKRDGISTPKNSTFLRDYTSDKNLPFASSKIFSEYNQIQQFTLEDKKSINQVPIITKKKSKFERKIVPTYSIYYIPQNDTTYMKTEVDLKRSSTSQFSQSSFNQKQQRLLFTNKDTCQIKASMTTNHRSAVTQSFQSLGKSSNDSQFNSGSRNKNDLFTSNNSHKTTYSIIKSSFVQNEPGRNNNSFVIIGNNYQNTHSSPLNHAQIVNNLHNNSSNRKDMYTFGGLINTNNSNKAFKALQFSQINEKQPQNHAQFKKNIKQSPISHKHHQSAFDLNNNVQQRTLQKHYNTKSIEQLYNNLYFNSQKKSMILQESQYQIKLSPVKQESCSNSVVNNSFSIDMIDIKNDLQLIKEQKIQKGQFEKNHGIGFSTPSTHHHKLEITPSHYQHHQPNAFNNDYNFNQPAQFQYNQWKGIKGLLNESNMHEMKQSIHCGPDIRSPTNFKLQLLDKFGREIGQSILPNTPMGHHYSYSRDHSVMTHNSEQHSHQFY